MRVAALVTTVSETIVLQNGRVLGHVDALLNVVKQRVLFLLKRLQLLSQLLLCQLGCLKPDTVLGSSSLLGRILVLLFERPEFGLGLGELLAQVLVLLHSLLGALLGIEQVLFLQSQLLFQILQICRLIAISLVVSRGFRALTQHIFSDRQRVVRLEVQDAPLAQLLVILQLLEALRLGFDFVRELAHEGRLAALGVHLQLLGRHVSLGAQESRRHSPVILCFFASVLPALDSSAAMLVRMHIVMIGGCWSAVVVGVWAHLSGCELRPVLLVWLHLLSLLLVVILRLWRLLRHAIVGIGSRVDLTRVVSANWPV